MISISDVPAWAWGPEPAQAGPGKPGQAWAVVAAYRGSQSRLHFLKAWAQGLSHGLRDTT